MLCGVCGRGVVEGEIALEIDVGVGARGVVSGKIGMGLEKFGRESGSRR